MNSPSSDSSKPVVYECIACKEECTVNMPAPEKWEWNRRQGPRVLCPTCGCACVPKDWKWAAAQQCLEDSRLSLKGLVHTWSGCPNSQTCETYGHYAGDCEQGLPARPKCLAPLYGEIESISRRLTALESKAPARRARSAKE